MILATISLVTGGLGPVMVARFTTGWARLCSLPWSGEVRNRYVSEIRSHVDQHYNDPDMAGRTTGQLALLLLLDTTSGMPGDVL